MHFLLSCLAAFGHLPAALHSLLSSTEFHAILGLIAGSAMLGACDVFDAFRYASESLGPDVARTASYRSIWLGLIPRGVFKKNVGTNISVFSIANSEPVDDSGVWNQIDVSQQGVNENLDTPTELCTPDWTDVGYGFNEGTYGPERKQLRGPEICKDEFDFSHDPDTFMAGYLQEIAKNAQREWELNLEHHHVRLSKKAVAITNFESSWKEQESQNGIACPTCELTQEMLEMVAERLIDDGATTPDSNGFITFSDNGPIFSLYIGMRQSQRILRQNSELRQDYRYADPNTLIARIGANRVIGNFRHVIAQKPARATCSGGTYTLVPRKITATGGAVPTKGTAQIDNPAWHTAPYEAADVLSPYLFTSEIVQQVTKAGGVSFDPVTDYMGNFNFVTGAYKWDTTCVDPLEQKGRHFGQLVHAPKPNLAARFKYGWRIWFKRCLGNAVECTTCSS